MFFHSIQAQNPQKIGFSIKETLLTILTQNGNLIHCEYLQVKEEKQ